MPRREGIERRRYERRRVNDCHLYYREKRLANLFRRGQQGAGILPGFAVDLSEGGAQFLSKEKEEEGKKIEIFLDAPSLPETLKMTAVVRWCEKVPERNAYRIGVEFIRMSKDMARTIRSLVDDSIVRGMKRETRKPH